MFLGGELLIDNAPLGLADALDDDLLGSLGGDAAKLLGLHRHADHIAHLGPAADLLGSFQNDLMAGVLNLIHDELVDIHVNPLLVLIQNDLHIVLALRVVTAESGQHSLLDFVIHIGLGYALFSLDIRNCLKKFCVHFSNSVLLYLLY